MNFQFIEMGIGHTDRLGRANRRRSSIGERACRMRRRSRLRQSDNFALDFDVSACHAHMLTLMFDPALHQKVLDETFRGRRILHQSPLMGPIAPPLLGETVHGLLKRRLLVHRDAMPDRDHHRTVIARDFCRDNRLRPMSRALEIARTDTQLMRARQSNRQHRAERGDRKRTTNSSPCGDPAPAQRSCRPTAPISAQSNRASQSSWRSSERARLERSKRSKKQPPTPSANSRPKNASTSSLTPDTTWIIKNLL